MTSPMGVPFALVDAFADRAFAGNTAGAIARRRALRRADAARRPRAGADGDLLYQRQHDASGRSRVALVHAPGRGRPLWPRHRGRIAWRGNRAAVRCLTRTGTIDVEPRRRGAQRGHPCDMLRGPSPRPSPGSTADRGRSGPLPPWPGERVYAGDRPVRNHADAVSVTQTPPRSSPGWRESCHMPPPRR